MRILLDGYFDSNLGDDLMLALAADGLSEHELYIRSKKIKYGNIMYANAKSGFDCYLKVTGSGFLIGNNKGILYRMRDMRAEKKYAPITAAVNCNISPFISKAAEIVVNRQLRGYDFITVRDSFSYDYITKNTPRVNCGKYPDMVFSTPDSLIPDTDGENALGISAHKSAHSGKLAEIADGYIRETGKKVLLLCFDSGEENDFLYAQKIYGAMKYREKTEIIRYTDIREMLSHMKRCGVILGIRLHCVILALRMGIPLAAMAYSDKTRNVLSDINYGKTVYSAENFSVNEVLGGILNAKPFALDRAVTDNAGRHIKDFNEYIKNERQKQDV